MICWNYQTWKWSNIAQKCTILKKTVLNLILVLNFVFYSKVQMKYIRVNNSSSLMWFGWMECSKRFVLQSGTNAWYEYTYIYIYVLECHTIYTAGKSGISSAKTFSVSFNERILSATTFDNANCSKSIGFLYVAVTPICVYLYIYFK